jgi:hypothetical protein
LLRKHFEGGAGKTTSRGATSVNVELPCGTGTPAAAYHAVFCEQTAGGFDRLSDHRADLARVAAAFRAVEAAAGAWVEERFGWDLSRKRELTQAFPLGLGDWLTDGYRDLDSPSYILELIWDQHSARG